MRCGGLRENVDGHGGLLARRELEAEQDNLLAVVRRALAEDPVSLTNLTHALLASPAGERLARIVNVGLDYVVPRADGRLLVGSTIEDAGFAPATTPEAVARLLDLAHRLLGPLPEAVVERAWAGLRPGSNDGLPFIGRAPGCDNAFVAAGHFRAGLHQSTGTAVMLADLLTGRTPVVDPTPFAPDRRPAAASPDSVQAYLARVAAGS